jgi:hypothetical protein
LVAVYTTSGWLAAQVVKGKLESEGIEVLLQYESAASMLPMTVDGLGEVKLLVHAADEKKARQALKRE